MFFCFAQELLQYIIIIYLAGEHKCTMVLFQQIKFVFFCVCNLCTSDEFVSLVWVYESLVHLYVKRLMLAIDIR